MGKTGNPPAGARASADGATEALVGVTITAPVRHDGVDYAVGETLTLTRDQAAALVAAGAAEAA